MSCPPPLVLRSKVIRPARVECTVLTLLLGLWLLPAAGSAQPTLKQQIRAQTEARLHSIADTTQGRLGLAAFDLEAEERFTLHGDLVFPQGSAIKIPILMEVFQQAHGGAFALSDRRTIPEETKVGGSGLLKSLGSNSAFTIRDLCVLMIMESDNTATNVLIDLVGMENVNETMVDLGLSATKLRRKMMDTAARGRGDENVSTPAEAARLMAMLYRGNFVSEKVSKEVLSILGKTPGGRIAAGVPDDVPVAYKPGGLPGVSAEWALVELDARPYVVAIMGTYGLDRPFGAAMEAVSRTLYDYYWRVGHATEYGTYVDPSLIKP